jgi:hypothetical protein
MLSNIIKSETCITQLDTGYIYIVTTEPLVFMVVSFNGFSARVHKLRLSKV